MRKRLGFLAVLLVAAGPQAQTSREIATADARAIAECVAAAESRAALEACRGRISEGCAATDSGVTTAGSIACHTRELRAWAVALNAVVETLVATDTDAAELLRAAQAAWLPWRAAKCAHEASRYSGGSIAPVVSAACFADETAARAIALIARQRDFPFASEPNLPADGIAEIGIERTDCLGMCPVYLLVFSSDGTFRYKGVRYVSRIGKFSGTVDRGNFDELARFVEDSGFMNLESSYSWNATDQATVITTVVVDGVRKSVRNYGGGGPAKLEDLEKRIDAALVDAQWDAPPPASPAGDPPWVDALIAQFQSAPVANPPRAIWRHRYETETLYYVPSDCCDQYDELRAPSGAVLCAPSGGFTGRGDGRCPALGEPLERTIVWQDPRPAR